jgi:hypothetical protein
MAELLALFHRLSGGEPLWNLKEAMFFHDEISKARRA